MEVSPQQGPNLKRLPNILLLMFGIQSSFRLWNSRRCVRPKPVTFNHSQPIAELYGALKRSKVGKAPGPDSLSMDWIKVSPLQSKHLLLAHNSCLFAADAPDSWKLARVAMIYKGKGKDPRSPASYHPISLANSFYKLYASMHQHTNTASHLRLMIFCHPISSVFVNQDLLQLRSFDSETSRTFWTSYYMSTFSPWTGSRLSTRSTARRCWPSTAFFISSSSRLPNRAYSSTLINSNSFGCMRTMMFRFLLLSPLRLLVSANIVGALIQYLILARWTILPTLDLFLMPLLPLLLTAYAVSARPPLPTFSNKPIPIKRRLQLHISQYGSESQTYTLAQLQRFNALHVKVLRQIFGVKSIQKFVLSPGACAPFR